MVVTNFGISGLTFTGFANTGSVPRWAAIGSGSGTALVTQSGLLAIHSNLRKQFTTRDMSIQKQASYTFDWNSIELSGLNFSEFGMFGDSSGGTIWDRHTLGSLTFDGSIELQLQITTKIS